MITDVEAWNLYPHHRDWFNKMHVAMMHGYHHGPGGIAVPTEGEYIVRPITNLYGMGAGASIRRLSPSNPNTVPPGYFWCERFTGDHVSHELTWTSRGWRPTSAWKAVRSSDNLSLIDKWVKVDSLLSLIPDFDVLNDVHHINVETIGDKVIEVHLRSTPDPIQWDELIPVWNINADTLLHLATTHTFINSPDWVFDTDMRRLGFYCRNFCKDT